MFNLPQNNQQLIPMGMQQQPIANMPIQNAQTYYPSVKNLSYGNDTFVNVGAPQKDIAKGFWDGFKTVFSKIGEFCSDNFALILTGVGLFGGCKFCSSSMKTYEENKKNNKLDNKGNLRDKDASLKDKAMNSFGYYVHKVFGSSNSEEVKEEVKKEDETTKLDNSTIQNIQENPDSDASKKVLEKLILAGNISSLLNQFEGDLDVLSTILDIISKNMAPIKQLSSLNRPKNIVKAVQKLNNDSNYKAKAKEIANNLKKWTSYFKNAQIDQLEEIAKTKIDQPQQKLAETPSKDEDSSESETKE